MSNTQQVTVAGFLVLIIITVFMLGRSGKSTDVAVAPDLRTVHVASVASLSRETEPLTLIGKVSSVSEASVKSESSGKITVYKKLGDAVVAGTVIAEIGNEAERAAVLQAEGAYESALVGLNRVKTGARSEQKDISAISNDQAALSLDSAKINAMNVINSTYSTLDDAVRTKTDITFSNPTNNDIRFLVGNSDSRMTMQLEEERSSIETVLSKRLSTNAALTKESDLLAELSAVEAETQATKQYLDDLLFVLNKGIASTQMPQFAIDGYKTNATIARSAVIGQLSAITGAKENLNAKLAAQGISEKQLAQTEGGDTNDLMQAEAGVKQALGNLRSAQARLEKTISRSPLSGTINRLPVDTGDYISPFTEVAVVSNNTALEIVSYMSEEDMGDIAVGSNVTIEGGEQGVITKIAPALDPVSKKIEVRVGITNPKSNLLNGQSVQLAIERTSKGATNVPSKLLIPLSAIKVTPTGSIVFTVDASSTLVSHEVTLGALLGDKVEIASGIDTDMTIVTDARGLQPGALVEVTQ